MKVDRSKVSFPFRKKSAHVGCRPIVHRAGGMLIQAKKEFVICADLQPNDVFFYYTTTLADLFLLTAASTHALATQRVDDVELPR